MLSYVFFVIQKYNKIRDSISFLLSENEWTSAKLPLCCWNWRIRNWTLLVLAFFTCFVARQNLRFVRRRESANYSLWRECAIIIRPPPCTIGLSIYFGKYLIGRTWFIIEGEEWTKVLVLEKRDTKELLMGGKVTHNNVSFQQQIPFQIFIFHTIRSET